MKITEAAQNAADKIVREYGDDVMPTDLVSMALRAAFAAVPDPLKLADRWDSEAQDYGTDPDSIYWMMDYARQLRAFMQGNGQ